MERLKPLLPALTALVCANAVMAQLVVVPNSTTPCAFGGGSKNIPVLFHNTGQQEITRHLRIRLYQETFATAVLIAQWPWKEERLLAGQCVRESAPVAFPSVRAETRFLVEWLAEGEVAGHCEVAVYPANLLDQMKPLLGSNVLGIFDPLNVLKPPLRRAGVPFEDLEDSKLEDFSGGLAIIGPVPPEFSADKRLPHQVKRMVLRGVAVVWIQSWPKTAAASLSYYLVPFGDRFLIIVEPMLLADMVENPESQLHLISLCRLALRSTRPNVPGPINELFK